MLTIEELDALIDCVNTHENEGLDVEIARSALNKLANEIRRGKEMRKFLVQTSYGSFVIEAEYAEIEGGYIVIKIGEKAIAIFHSPIFIMPEEVKCQALPKS